MPIAQKLKQEELPAMPPKTPLQIACDQFLDLRSDKDEIDEKISVKKEEIMAKLKDGKMTSVLHSGYLFEIEESELRLKVKEF